MAESTDPSADQSTESPGEVAEQALDQAQAAVDELAEATGAAESADQAGGGEARNVDLPNFQQVLADVEAGGLEMLTDVDLNVKIELGRTEMLVEDVLRLAEGSVVELDKLAGDPVDVYVNERLVARGEVLVLNDNFCVRVSEIVGDEAQPGEADTAAGAEDAVTPAEEQVAQ